jgi:hypothetical protein
MKVQYTDELGIVTYSEGTGFYVGDKLVSTGNVLTETGGPTILTVGAVKDGDTLVRSGSNIVGVALTTIVPLDFYFDAASGSSSNTGLSTGSAFKDIPDLVTSGRLPARIGHQITLHFKGSGTQGVAAIYNWPLFPALFVGAPFICLADETWDPTCFETVATLTAEAGTTGGVINVAGLAADLHDGAWIEFTSGAASTGSPRQRKQIRDNDTGSFTVQRAFSPACASGDTFKVKRSTGVRFNMDYAWQTSVAGEYVRSVSSKEIETASLLGVILFVGIELACGALNNNFGGGSFNGGNYSFYGCRKSWRGTPSNFTGHAWTFIDSQAGIGSTSRGLSTVTPGCLSSPPFNITDSRWLGWGIDQDCANGDHGSISPEVGGKVVGFIVASAVTPIPSLTSRGVGCRLELAGYLGATTGATSLIQLIGRVSLQLGNSGAAKTKLICTGAVHAIKTVNNLGNGVSSVCLSNFDIATVDGDALRLEDAGEAVVLAGVTGTPSGTGKSVVAVNGSRVLINGLPAMGGAYSVGNGADRVAANFSADGLAMLNAFDGSCIVRTSTTGTTGAA